MLKKNFKILLILSIIAVLAILSGISVVLYQQNQLQKQAKEDLYYTLPKMKIALQESLERNLHLTLTIHLHSNKDLENLKQRLPRFENFLNKFLSQLRIEDIKDTNITIYIEKQIYKRAKILYPGKIKEILIKEIFIE